jgi:hypothetical protein
MKIIINLLTKASQDPNQIILMAVLVSLTVRRKTINLKEIREANKTMTVNKNTHILKVLK